MNTLDWNGCFDAPNLPILYASIVPSYRGRSFKPFVARVNHWSKSYGEAVAQINPKRAASRIENYLDRNEISRISRRAADGRDYSLRFGVAKSGRGYHGTRGDFCLSSAAITNRRHLTLFYRSLELIGGLAYDLVLINELSRSLKTDWKSVTFMAAHAYVFALKRNSNEKLYPKFMEILAYG